MINKWLIPPFLLFILPILSLQLWVKWCKMTVVEMWFEYSKYSVYCTLAQPCGKNHVRLLSHLVHALWPAEPACQLWRHATSWIKQADGRTQSYAANRYYEVYEVNVQYAFSVWIIYFHTLLLTDIGTTTLFVTILLGLVDFWGCSAGVIIPWGMHILQIEQFVFWRSVTIPVTYLNAVQQWIHLIDIRTPMY